METSRISKPGKIAGIILAAGMGARMGTQAGTIKQLLPLGGRPVLERVIQNSLTADLDPLILVLGHGASKILDSLFESRTRVVINSRYKSGMAGSIRAGLTAVGPRCEGAMFLLGDQPLVDSPVLKKLIKAATDQTIVVPTFKGKQGNPVIFGRSFFPELDRLSGDIGGRALFKAHAERINPVPVDTGTICFDLDTPEDYERLCQREER